MVRAEARAYGDYLRDHESIGAVAVAAAGRGTWHARATDGKRVRKRSGHAAADSTMTRGQPVGRDDCWLSCGSPQAACSSSARALEDAFAMPAVHRHAGATATMRSQRRSEGPAEARHYDELSPNSC